MSSTERRTTERRAASFSVVVTTEASVLTGKAMNTSGQGILLTAHGGISVLVHAKEKEYRGRLVRATPVDEKTVAYAVELDELVEDWPPSEP